jgi:hypothetical protein
MLFFLKSEIERVEYERTWQVFSLVNGVCVREKTTEKKVCFR